MFNSSILLERLSDFKASSCFSVGLSKGFPKFVNLDCFIICLRLDRNFSSSVRYLYLSIFPDDNADIFAASRLLFYCSFSSLLLASIVMIRFYIISKRFFVKRKELFDSSIASLKKCMVLQSIFCKDS